MLLRLHLVLEQLFLLVLEQLIHLVLSQLLHLVLEHVAEELLHGRAAYRLLEVDPLHVGRGHRLERGQSQQQPREPCTL